MAAHSYDTTHSIEPEVLDADARVRARTSALQPNGIATVRVDEGVRDYLVRQLRRGSAAARRAPT
jgi:hypothetical protein